MENGMRVIIDLKLPPDHRFLLLFSSYTRLFNTKEMRGMAAQLNTSIQLQKHTTQPL